MSRKDTQRIARRAAERPAKNIKTWSYAVRPLTPLSGSTPNAAWWFDPKRRLAVRPLKCSAEFLDERCEAVDRQ